MIDCTILIGNLASVFALFVCSLNVVPFSKVTAKEIGVLLLILGLLFRVIGKGGDKGRC